MSTVISILKIATFGSIGSAAIGGIGYGVFSVVSNESNTTSINQSKVEEAADPETIKQTIFVIAESTGSQELDESTVFSNTTKNYKCKLSDSTTSDNSECSIQHLDTSTITKKYVQFSQLNTIAATDPDNAKLKQENNLFKIEVESTFYDSLLSTKPLFKSIKLISTSSDSQNKYFGTFKPLFGLKGTQITANTAYSVAKVSKITKQNNTDNTPDVNDVTFSSNEKKCKFLNNSEDEIKCEINSFSSNEETNFSQISFSGAETVAQKAVKDNYYLFKFNDDSSTVKSVEEFKKSSEPNVVINPEVKLTGDNGTAIDKLELSELTPAILSKTTGSNFIFLLGDIPTNNPS